MLEYIPKSGFRLGDSNNHKIFAILLQDVHNAAAVMKKSGAVTPDKTAKIMALLEVVNRHGRNSGIPEVTWAEICQKHGIDYEFFKKTGHTEYAQIAASVIAEPSVLDAMRENGLVEDWKQKVADVTRREMYKRFPHMEARFNNELGLVELMSVLVPAVQGAARVPRGDTPTQIRTATVLASMEISGQLDKGRGFLKFQTPQDNAKIQKAANAWVNKILKIKYRLTHNIEEPGLEKLQMKVPPGMDLGVTSGGLKRTKFDVDFFAAALMIKNKCAEAISKGGTCEGEPKKELEELLKRIEDLSAKWSNSDEPFSATGLYGYLGSLFGRLGRSTGGGMQSLLMATGVPEKVAFGVVDSLPGLQGTETAAVRQARKECQQKYGSSGQNYLQCLAKQGSFKIPIGLPSSTPRPPVEGEKEEVDCGYLEDDFPAKTQLPRTILMKLKDYYNLNIGRSLDRAKLGSLPHMWAAPKDMDFNVSLSQAVQVGDETKCFEFAPGSVTVENLKVAWCNLGFDQSIAGHRTLIKRGLHMGEKPTTVIREKKSEWDKYVHFPNTRNLGIKVCQQNPPENQTFFPLDHLNPVKGSHFFMLLRFKLNIKKQKEDPETVGQQALQGLKSLQSFLQKRDHFAVIKVDKEGQLHTLLY